MNESADIDRSPWAVFVIFLRLGLTSFGGPIAHLGYFRDEFVIRRQWLSERSYADLVALCQFLPGPASSQVGIAIGLSRSGYSGALAAWAGFTLPSAIALILFALGVTSYGDGVPSGVLHGLKVVAVAVVAQAVWGMARHLCPDSPRVTIMVAATCSALAIPTTWGQIGIIFIAAMTGVLLLKSHHDPVRDPLPIEFKSRYGFLWLTLFFVLLVVLPLLPTIFQNRMFSMIDAFYRSGALVFGGGHVVLPLLQAEVVNTGWVSRDEFLFGYGVAQAVPGPLFTFAAFLGASMNDMPSGWLGGLVCLTTIFAPSFFLIIGVLPYWERIRRNSRMQSALLGINAAVVGLLMAALYNPLWTSTIHAPKDFCLALVALVALMFWKLPSWLVVVGTGIVAALLSVLS
jgi:chromate transporter